MSKSRRIGANAVDLIGDLLTGHPEIEELSVFEPENFPLVQERVSDVESSAILDAGFMLRQRSGLPFWDAVLLSCFEKGVSAFEILNQAQFHSRVIRRITIKRLQWSAEHLANVSTNLGGMLVISSRVRLKGGQSSHIPMLDFHAPVTSENEKLAGKVVSFIEPRGGYLLQSDKSYHFYGKELIGEQELYGFLGRALLFCPIADRAWIAHQLIEGACGLRISTKVGGERVPRVIAEF